MKIQEFLNLSKYNDDPAFILDDQLIISYRLLQHSIHLLENQLRETVKNKVPRGFIILIDENHVLISTFLAASSIKSTTILDPNATIEEIIDRVGDLNFNYLICCNSTANKAILLSKLLKLNVILLNEGFKEDDVTVSTKLIERFPDGHNVKPIDEINDEVALILHTSGSTGKPKCVPLKHKNIIYNIERIAKGMQLSPHDCTVCVMPLFHVHGLFASVMASLYSGASIYIFSNKINFDSVSTMILNGMISWFTAVPTIHYQILEKVKSATTGRDIKLRFIRSCSSSLPIKLREELNEYFRVPILEAYGMTEASHQIAMQNINTIVPGSVGKVNKDEIKIFDSEGLELKANEHGEVVIKGDNVIRGYLFRNSSDSIINNYFRTGDIGYIDGENNLFLYSRIKEIINKGGEKISPIAVENNLLKYPGIRDAVCFAVPHETLGEDIHAALVINPETPCQSADIKEFLLNHLSIEWIPTTIHFVEQIPKSKTGKVQRGMMHTYFNKTNPVKQQLPNTDNEKILFEIFKKVLKVTDFDIHTNFFELGGDSLQATELIYQTYQKTGKAIDYKSIILAPTIYELAKLISSDEIITDYFQYLEFFKNKIAIQT